MITHVNAPIDTQTVRRQFLDFFISKGHTEVASSSLIPHNDPTLLFTNAGMNQFKETFLGIEDRGYLRAVSSQRCVRAGGKHNDLENVGFTARHHTFFEMLGNFSFGDYFKTDAIKLAWELLTEVYKLPEDKLTVTVYHTDDEAFDIWKNIIGVPVERIIRIPSKADGTSDNFWQMGDTGPCGPCSEIFYDHGDTVFGGPPGSKDEEGDRFIEIWNLVFMQFNRDESGTLTPLPKPSIDTGMGLERLAAVLQHVQSNYEIDLFKYLIAASAKAVKITDLTQNSLKVISDHIRSVAFLIVDGILPSNEGRGYVLRRITRRAIRHGYKLGQKQPFFWMLVQTLVDEMGEAYPELKAKQSIIENAIKNEEIRFAETLENGLKLLDADIKKLTNKTIPGETIFKLYDTYGFPVDLTNDIAREQQLELDMEGFERCMEAQRNRARAANQFSAEKIVTLHLDEPIEFCGYSDDELESEVIALVKAGEEVTELNANDSGIVVLKRTPFYAEAGGQAGDKGVITTKNGARFIVNDTKKQGDNILHIGLLEKGHLKQAELVHAAIDSKRRDDIRKNHSATHLLHKALQELLGAHVEQKGSYVEDIRLRFDFAHGELIPLTMLQAIETHVNRAVMNNNRVDTQEMSIIDAKAKGAMALFGEKYGSEVRVVEMGDSIELCGGTHVTQTGDIGLFKIISEAGIAAGIRRIEATTGIQALAITQTMETLIDQASDIIKSTPERLIQKIEQILAELKASEKTLAQTKSKLVLASSDALLQSALNIKGVSVILAAFPDVDTASLKELGENLRDKSQGVVLLISSIEGRVALAAAVDKALNSKIKAGELVNIAASKVGGKGGGRPDSATAGGSDPSKIDEALKAANDWLVDLL